MYLSAYLKWITKNFNPSGGDTGLISEKKTNTMQC